MSEAVCLMLSPQDLGSTVNLGSRIRADCRGATAQAVEVAATAPFLASPEVVLVNGVWIPVDGRQTVRRWKTPGPRPSRADDGPSIPCAGPFRYLER